MEMMENYSAAELAERMAYAAEEKARFEAAHKRQQQFDHPFYKRVDDFRDEIKRETLIKASEKYPEPFNPGSWSIKQLGKHAMAENYDQGNYIVGLMDAAEALEVRVAALQKDVAFYIESAELWRLKALKADSELLKYKNRCRDYESKINELSKGAIIDERV